MNNDTLIGTRRWGERRCTKKRGQTYADEPGEDLLQVTSHLHGNNSEMVFLVHPDQESFRVIVVDTSTARPVAASVGCLQEPAKRGIQAFNVMQSSESIAIFETRFSTISFRTLWLWHIISLSSFYEPVTLLEEEMIVDQLLLDALAHSCERIVGALELTGQTFERGRDFLLHFAVLLENRSRSIRCSGARRKLEPVL